MEEGKIMVIPFFYKLDISAVKGLEGEGGFGLNLLNPAMREFDLEQLKIWKEALDLVSCMMGFQLHMNSDESKRTLTQMSMAEKICKSHDRLNEEQNDDFVNTSKSERVNGEEDGRHWIAKFDENPKDVLESDQGEA